MMVGRKIPLPIKYLGAFASIAGILMELIFNFFASKLPMQKQGERHFKCRYNYVVGMASM